MNACMALYYLAANPFKKKNVLFFFFNLYDKGLEALVTRMY